MAENTGMVITKITNGSQCTKTGSDKNKQVSKYLAKPNKIVIKYQMKNVQK